MRWKALWLAAACAFSAASCSYVLDSVLAPFAPDFTPTLRDAAEGVEVIDGEIIAMPQPDDYSYGEPVSWSMPYALYVFRSATSPYDGLELIARKYLANAAISRIGQTPYVETTYDMDGDALYDSLAWDYPEYDFTLTDGLDSAGVVNAIAGTDDSWLDEGAPEGESYYRLSRVWLYRSVTELTLELNEYDSNGLVTSTDEVTEIEISYYLSSSTSGWASVVNEP